MTNPQEGSQVESLFGGAGEMRALCRSTDWSATPLGPVERWPPAVKVAVRLVLDSPLSMCLWAGPEQVLIYNAGYALTLGDERHPRALGRPGREVWPDIWCWLGVELAQVGRGESIHRVDRRAVLSVGGRELEVSLSYTLSPIRDDGGRIVGSLGVVHEPSSEAREELDGDGFRSAFEAIDEGFQLAELVNDAEGNPVDIRVLEANPSWGRLTGLDWRRARGKLVWKQLMPQLDRSWLDLYARVARTGESLRFEKYAASTGRWMDCYSVPVGERHLGRYAVVFRDITARKRAEEALRQSEERQAFLLRLSDAMRELNDVAAIKTTAVEAVGHALGVAAAGYVEIGPDSESMSGGRQYDDGRLPAMREHMRMADYGPFADIVRRGSPLFVEDSALDERGPEPEAVAAVGIRSVAVIPISRDGRLAAFLYAAHCEPRKWPEADRILLHEVSHRTWAAVARCEAEVALVRANEGLAEVDRRKNQFLAMLSHELRNPLTPVKNSLYILDRAAPEGDQARRARHVIGRQIDQLSRLVDDLLDVTRISRGKIQLQRRRLELNELVRRTLEDYRAELESAELQVRLQTAPGDVFINADWNRVGQVLGNLLQNAAKFTPRGGRVTVGVSTDATAQQAVVRVADTGAGMPRELVERLFVPFMQADETLDRSRGGLGLGLALVRGLAEQHGGSVEANSEGPGRGSEFIVRLPLDHSAELERERARAHDGKAFKRVLIIEDNVDAAESLSEVLQLVGHDVRVAHDGHDGIELARDFLPDIVICDIGLPGMDGYEVARALRSDPVLRDTRLVALSGYALPEDLQRATEAGFQRHLSKPPNLEKLEQVLEEPPH